MTQQIINAGVVANDGQGDTLRTGATKINGNFTELYSQIGVLAARDVIPSQSNNGGKFLTTTAGVLSWSSLIYTLPTATVSTLGGVKVDGTSITITDQVIRVGSISYSKISNPPSIPSQVSQLTNDLGFLTAVSWDGVTNKPTFATVATSGSYADLLNRPVLFSGSYNDLTNKPTFATGVFIGTTNVSLNRDSSNLALTGVSIDGNAATVTNGIYTSGSYSNPSWITNLAYSKLTGTPAGYSLPTASTTQLGGVRIDGSTLAFNGIGQLYATGSGNLDGGTPTSIYGGVTNIDAGGVTT